MTIYVAYCKILLKENGYKIVQLYLLELNVSWFVGSFSGVRQCFDLNSTQNNLIFAIV
jgi:hypothetical protein